MSLNKHKKIVISAEVGQAPAPRPKYNDTASERRTACSPLTRKLRLTAIAVVLGVSLLTAGCSVGSKDGTAERNYHETPFRASNFVDPRAGSNKWFPLEPGTQWVREGTTLIGNRVVPHQVITTVTDVIREIKGVKTVLVYDYSVGAGQVVQRSLDYFAQDKYGNVWTMGGATEQYEAGRFVAVDEVWSSGVDGGKPGILMPANPTASTPAWSIARPPGEDGDAAEFARMQKEECVPFSCFENVLVIREGKRSALSNEFKYYAFGVGQIRNEPLGASRHQPSDQRDDCGLATVSNACCPVCCGAASLAGLRR